MIEEIRISSLGVIDESVLELGDGLTVITGETGAGKTMLVTALGLLLGGRADTGRRTHGAARRPGRGRGPRRRRRCVALADEHGGEVEAASCCSAARSPPRAGRGPSSAARRCRRPRSAGSARPSWPCTASPTSTGCCGPTPSATRSTRFAGAGAGGVLERYAAGYARLRAPWRPSCARCSGPRGSAPARPTCCGSGSRRSRRSTPVPARRTRWPPRRHGWASPTRCARLPRAAREALSSDQDAADALGAVAAARRALEGVREHDPEAAALADRVAEVSYLLVRRRGRRRVVRHRARDRPPPARGRLRTPGRADRAHPEVRRDGRPRCSSGPGSPPNGCWSSTTPTSGSRRCAPSGQRLRQRPGRSRRPSSPGCARQPESGSPPTVTDELHSLSMPHARFEVRLDRVEDERGLEIDGGRWRFHGAGVDEVELRAGRQHRFGAAAAGQGGLGRRAVPGDARHRGGAGRDPSGADVRLRRGGRRRRRQGRGRDRPSAGRAGRARPRSSW